MNPPTHLSERLNVDIVPLVYLSFRQLRRQPWEWIKPIAALQNWHWSNPREHTNDNHQNSPRIYAYRTLKLDALPIET